MSDSSSTPLKGGELPDGRRAMRDLEGRLRSEGYSSEKAREKALTAALKHDRQRSK
jgi:hypothetical protein